MTPADDLKKTFDEAILKAPPAQGNGKGQPDAMEAAIREAVTAGTINPLTALPDAAEELREWARFVSLMEPVERELRVSDKLAVMSALHENAREIVDAALAGAEMERRAAGSGPEGDRVFIDWSTFWSEDDDEQEWVWRNVLAKGRGHAIYAVHKGGKSLLALYMAADMATSGFSCLYLDYEMTKSDVRERLRDMGYGPESDLSHLYYALLPTLPALDSEEGGVALAQIVDRIAAADPGRHLVTVIDTISRAVWGEENSADTWRLFYVHTGLRLKQRGVTWLRLDHGGKDSAKGQRGSSGKGDDVDVVWKLTPTENGITLHRELARMSWVPETVALLQEDFPLCYLPAKFDWPEGTAVLANIMDRLGLPLDVNRRVAGAELRKIDEGRRHEVVSAALKFRRERAESRLGTTLGDHGDHPSGPNGARAGDQAVFSLGTSAGTTGDQGARVLGTAGSSFKRDPHPPDADRLSIDIGDTP